MRCATFKAPFTSDHIQIALSLRLRLHVGSDFTYLRYKVAPSQFGNFLKPNLTVTVALTVSYTCIENREDKTILIQPFHSKIG